MACQLHRLISLPMNTAELPADAPEALPVAPHAQAPSLILSLKRAEQVILGSMTSRPFCVRAGEGIWGIACRVQAGLAVSEAAVEGTAVKERVAVRAQVADGPVLVSPGAGRAGAGRAGRGAAAGRVHSVAGLAFTSRPGRPLSVQSGPGPRENVRENVREASSADLLIFACVAGRPYGTASHSCLYQFGLCVGQAAVASKHRGCCL
jgi:hypothetical protein